MNAGEEIFMNHNLDKLSIAVFRLESLNGSLFNKHQRCNFHQIIWFTKSGGDRSYFIDFNDFLIAEDQIVVIFPGQMNKFEIKEKEGFLFAIHNDVFFNLNQKIQSNYLNGYFSNALISLSQEEKTLLHYLIILILHEYTGLNRIVLMESYLQSFLFHLSSLFKEDTSLKKEETFLFVQFIQLTDRHFISQRGVNFYTKELSVTASKLNEVCKKMTGMTTKQLIQDRLVLEIKKEIVLGEKNLKEISFELGFNEPAYFTRFFKQQTSMSPKEFMKKKTLFLSN